MNPAISGVNSSFRYVESLTYEACPRQNHLEATFDRNAGELAADGSFPHLGLVLATPGCSAPRNSFSLFRREILSGIKLRKESGMTTHLIASCATEVMFSSVQFSLKTVDENRIIRVFPEMSDMELPYVRCPM